MKKIFLILLLGAFALASCAPAGTSEMKFENDEIKIEKISLGNGAWVYVATQKDQPNITTTITSGKHSVTTVTINENGDTLSVDTRTE